MPEEKIMKLKEAIQNDGQRHLYVKSAITSGTTQYMVQFVHSEVRRHNKSAENEIEKLRRVQKFCICFLLGYSLNLNQSNYH